MPTRSRPPSNTTRNVPRSSDTIEILDPVLRLGFAQLPRAILKAPGLSRNAKCLYALLLDYAWQDGHCFPGQKRLMADLGISERTLRDDLNELRSYELIDWQRRGMTKTNVYFILSLTKNARLALAAAEKNGSDRQNPADQERQNIADQERQNSADRLYTEDYTQLLLDTEDISNRPPTKNPSAAASQNGAQLKPPGADTPKNPRGRPPKPTPSIDRYLRQFSDELHDSDHAKSNVTHAMRLLRASGLTESDFLQLVFQAREITKKRGNIEKVASDCAPLKNRMPYFFACLEQLLTRQEPVAEEAATDLVATSEQLVWQAVLAQLAATISTDAFKTYLRDTVLTSYDGQKAVISAQEENISEWLEKRLNHKITAAFKHVVGENIACTYTVIEK